MTLCNRTRMQRERVYRDACLSAPPKQMFPHPTPAGIAVYQPPTATMRRTSESALVLEVIARVYELAERRTQPFYIDRAALDLGHASDSVDSSIYYAEVSGWLVGAGEPPKSVAVTADGVRLLEECGFI
jgi:hypothetical protein